VNIQIIIFDGFEELDAIGPYETLRLASDLKPGLQVHLVTMEMRSEIIAANGLSVRPHGHMGHSRPDILIVPGGGWLNRATNGTWAEVQHGVLPAKLAQLHRSGVMMASVCTGAMLLAIAGLLKSRPATTNRGAFKELRATGAEVITERVVDDGDIITSGGIMCGIDLSLWLIERFISPEAARTVEERLEYERRGKVWRRESKDARKTPAPV
jgi:transcriptional regulator GlxA family with amidase domain